MHITYLSQNYDLDTHYLPSKGSLRLVGRRHPTVIADVLVFSFSFLSRWNLCSLFFRGGERDQLETCKKSNPLEISVHRDIYPPRSKCYDIKYLFFVE